MTGTCRLSAIALMGALAVPTAALAQNASATTDLTIRVGPGPHHELVTVIPVAEPITIHGCLDDMSWCEVSWSTYTGWAYADYLAYELEGSPVVLREAAGTVDVPQASYDGAGAGAFTGAVGGAITGAIIGGPIGAAIGGVAGAALGTAVTPSAQVQAHVAQQPVEPVFLQGEVVMGATLPDAVVLHPVPDQEYQFAYVNHQRVLVDPQTRQVVYILR